MAKHGKKLTSAKAKKMLREGKTRGKKLTSRQKRFLGLIAGGKKPTRVKSSHTSKKSRKKGY